MFFPDSELESICNLEMMPKVTNMWPTGFVTPDYNTISATVAAYKVNMPNGSPRAIDIVKTLSGMRLDGVPVTPLMSGSASEATVSYTAPDALAPGEHVVSETYDTTGEKTVPTGGHSRFFNQATLRKL